MIKADILKISFWKRKKSLFSLGVFIVLAVFIMLFRAPSDFPEGRLIKVEEGQTLSQIASYLKEKSVINSEILFKGFVFLFDGDVGAKAGDYFFESREGVIVVAKRIARSQYGLDPIKVTIVEGSTLDDIAGEMATKFDNFKIDKFWQIAQNRGPSFIEEGSQNSLEGFLFPDTYFLLPNIDAEGVVTVMEENFRSKITPEMELSIKDSGHTLLEIVTMASIVEKEVRDSDTRKIVSGLLWKRIDAGMPLQVDAVFPYIISKNTFQLSLDDLKIDSPYNTYLYKGLPPGPIASPSLDSIMAAVYPQETPFWFYLSDREGRTHFAATFDEHKVNKAKYLQ